MDPKYPNSLNFAEFTLELQPARLRKGAVPVPLQSQPLRLLTLLASRAGEIVTHKDIQKVVWGDLQVDFASGMHVCIGQIRKALDDNGQQPRFVETIPRRGYRFVAAVVSTRTDNAAVHAEPDESTDTVVPEARRTRPLLPALLAVLLLALLVTAVVVRSPIPVPNPATPATEDAYLLGLKLLATGDEQDAVRSRALFERAIAADPDFAPALVGMAKSHELSRDYAQAGRFARQAMALDPTYAQAHLRLAAAQSYGDWDWAGAAAHLSKALELTPDDPEARLALAANELITGRQEQARSTLAAAVPADSSSARWLAESGMLFYYSGDLEQAGQRCAAATRIDPADQPARRCLYQLARARKEDADAQAQALELLRLAPAKAGLISALAASPAPLALRRFEEWRIEQLDAHSKSGVSDPLQHAYSLAALQRYDEAFFYLLRGRDLRYAMTPLSTFDPIFIPIRHQSKYLEMLDSMGVVYESGEPQGLPQIP